MAIEDAYLLAKLAAERPKDLSAALQEYYEDTAAAHRERSGGVPLQCQTVPPPHSVEPGSDLWPDLDGRKDRAVRHTIAAGSVLCI